MGRRTEVRVLICGDRNWTDTEAIEQVLDELEEFYTVACVIDGAARGADTLGHEAAERRDLTTVRFPANCEKFGPAAGALRNQQMLDAGRPDMVIAFHDDFEHSRGTRDMVRRAVKARIRTGIYRHGPGLKPYPQ